MHRVATATCSPTLLRRAAVGGSSGRSERALSVYKQLQHNKTGLSYELDSTLRDGHHNMKLFVTGFCRSISSPVEQAHTFESLRQAYAALEDALDAAPSGTRAARFWAQFQGELRKAPALRDDVNMLGGFDAPTPAAARYADAIRAAANDGGDPADDGSRGDLLLAHAYVRYLADLFGGSFLGRPTQVALQLKQPLRFYHTPDTIHLNRKDYIDTFYAALNDAGEAMDVGRRQALVNEARRAYKFNEAIYLERPGFLLGAAVGVGRYVLGATKEQLSMSGRR